MVLDARVHLIGPNGEREMPITEFYQLDGMTRNVLQPGEFMLKVSLPDDVANWTGAYRKLRLRDTWDFPEAGAAAAWKKGDRSIKSRYNCIGKHSTQTRYRSCRIEW